MAKLRIRQTKDTNAVHTLDAQVFDYQKHHPVSTEGSTWWIVYDGEEPVAYAGADFLKEKNTVYLCRAGVLPEYRGMGLQKELIKRRLKWAKEVCEVDVVVTYTDVDNVHSVNNLIKSGFLMYSPDFPWGSSDDALYWKRIF